MRVFVGLFLVVLSFSLAASAADLKIKVVDPQGAAVAGAQVSLDTLADVAFAQVVRTTAGEGTVTFIADPAWLGCRIQVLASGFAAETMQVSKQQIAKETEITVTLRLATASETVVVTATRTPVLGEAAGADIDTLSGAQLTTMQPVTGNDAMRFLPGAVVNTAGQRGGLSSLFVRGGNRITTR